jgi:diguanylate cyclase (GGDEF)-like protein
MPGRLVWDEDRTVRIYSAFAGRVTKILAKLGESVKPGQTLALVASPDFGEAQADARKAESDLALAQKNVALRQQSSRDPLTALYNRRHFQEFIRDLPAPAERRRGAGEAPVQALLLIDIDHFKQINDRHGHAAGDAVLMVVAERLRDTLRETDMIVRWGGEEFLVFVPVAPLDRMDEIVLRIMSAIAAAPIAYMGHDIRVTASVGYLPMPLPPDNLRLDWDGAIRLVDKALYMAKSQGRNRAYGVAALHARGSDPEHGVDGDLETAWRDGVVELRLLSGMPVDDGHDAPARPAAKVH